MGHGYLLPRKICRFGMSLRLSEEVGMDRGLGGADTGSGGSVYERVVDEYGVG